MSASNELPGKIKDCTLQLLLNPHNNKQIEATPERCFKILDNFIENGIGNELANIIALIPNYDNAITKISILRDIEEILNKRGDFKKSEIPLFSKFYKFPNGIVLCCTLGSGLGINCMISDETHVKKEEFENSGFCKANSKIVYYAILSFKELIYRNFDPRKIEYPKMIETDYLKDNNDNDNRSVDDSYAVAVSVLVDLFKFTYKNILEKFNDTRTNKDKSFCKNGNREEFDEQLRTTYNSYMDEIMLMLTSNDDRKLDDNKLNNYNIYNIEYIPDCVKKAVKYKSSVTDYYGLPYFEDDTDPKIPIRNIRFFELFKLNEFMKKYGLQSKVFLKNIKHNGNKLFEELNYPYYSKNTIKEWEAKSSDLNIQKSISEKPQMKAKTQALIKNIWKILFNECIREHIKSL